MRKATKTIGSFLKYNFYAKGGVKLKNDTLRIAKLVFYFLVMSFIATGCGSSGGGDDGGGGSTANENDFVGTWIGTANIGGEDRQVNVTLDNTLTGSIVVTGTTRVDTHQPITGNVLNDVLFFDMPVSDLDTGDPDCINWDYSCEGRLSDNMTRMTTECSGIVCGPGGGQQFEGTFIVYKQ
jgi:hypothetical protein